MLSVPTPAITALEPAVKLPGTPLMVKLATVRVLSTSLSLPSTLPVAGLSSATLLVSATRTEASFTGMTSAKLSSAVSVRLPSETV
ncbi:hypothetical protein FUT48_03365 [Pseudomonas sp. JG-B]|nr:hypothetical protein [Pseudomonas sp. JG-B]